MESATQRPFHTSCLWRRRGRRWLRWIKWTLAMLALLSSRFMPFRRRRRLFCQQGWISTSVTTLILWLLVFEWFFFHFFVLGSTSSPFSFSSDSLRGVPCANFPWSLLDPMKEGLLVPFSELTCFLCPSPIASVAFLSAIDKENINEYQYDEYFLISSLQHAIVVPSFKEIKRMEDGAPVL